MQLNRRRFLLGAAVAATAAASGYRVRAQPGGIGPMARIEPVTDALHGQAVTDPYRWMENAADPDWLPWLRANDAQARAALEALPNYRAMNERLHELGSGFTRVSLPYEFGDRLLYLSQAPQSGWPVLKERTGATERVLFDPGTVAATPGDVSIEFWVASPDGRYMIFGLGSGGTEEAVIHILDLQSGALLDERIPRCLAPAPYWLEDGSGFFYTQLGVGVRGSLDYRADLRARFHRLGEDPSQDRVVMAQGMFDAVQVDRHDTPVIKVFAGSRWALCETGTLVTKGLWCAPLADVLAGRPDWKMLFEPGRGAPEHYLDGDHLWIWGSVSETESMVSTLDITTPPYVETVMATLNGGLISQSAFADEGLYLSVDGGTTAQLFFIPREGDGRELPLPFEAAINDVAYGADRRSVFLHMSTWLEPDSVWRYRPSKGYRQIELAPGPAVDTSAYRVQNGSVVARDGAEVPVTLISRRGLARNGQAPCCVVAYGAYGQSLTASFDPMSIALLEQGGIKVIAHVRGGGELGREWWMAGLGPTKANTWRDLIDVCQDLVNDGWTSSSRLAISGGSAGGIAVGRAMTERPDLFGLVASSGGVLNPLRFEFEANGLANVPEFGSIATQDGFNGLLAMDTLHSISDGVRYPAVLLTHGDNDPRVSTWHSAKAAARLRAAGAPGSGPVLFRVNFGRGHLIDSIDDDIDSKVGLYAWLLSLD